MAVLPPLILIIWPVTKDALSEARNTIASAISSDFAPRFKRYGSIERRFFVGRLGQTIEHRGLGRTRRDCIDADAQRGRFQSGGLRETFHRVLARGVEREIRRTALAHGRRNIDDAA